MIGLAVLVDRAAEHGPAEIKRRQDAVKNPNGWVSLGPLYIAIIDRMHLCPAGDVLNCKLALLPDCA